VLLLIGSLEVARSIFNRWSRRQSSPNQRNATVPRDFWLKNWEKVAIIAFDDVYPQKGYRRLTYMMLDDDVVAVSPSSIYHVLEAAGKLLPRWGWPSKRVKGFDQPVGPHEHRHIDVSYINICGCFDSAGSGVILGSG
jgi:putative transposase